MDSLDETIQDRIDLVDDGVTIPVVGYIRSDQLSSATVWIAATSGIAQQGILNQNIAYVFINGSGIYVRSILLQAPLGWLASFSVLYVTDVQKLVVTRAHGLFKMASSVATSMEESRISLGHI